MHLLNRTLTGTKHILARSGIDICFCEKLSGRKYVFRFKIFIFSELVLKFHAGVYVCRVLLGKLLYIKSKGENAFFFARKLLMDQQAFQVTADDFV